MPITLEAFRELDIARRSRSQNIIDFLKNNNNQAYTAIELSEVLDIPKITGMLYILKKNNKIVKRGKYYAYNNEVTTDGPVL